jgi:hypothetical protein
MRQGAVPASFNTSAVRSIAADEIQEAVQAKLLSAVVFGLVEYFLVAPGTVRSH